MNKFAWMLAALLLAGCAAGPDYVRPESELPERWTEAETRVADVDAWWHAFGDARLVALVEQALAHNHELRAAAANIEAAAARLNLARMDYVPTVNGAIESQRGELDGSGVHGEYRAGFAISYEIDLWGRIRRANEAALAEMEADVAVRDGVRAAVAAAVANAYFETRALERRIALATRLLETREANLELQRERLAAGLIPRYDYEQARSETAAVAAELAQLRNAHSQALTALAVLRGASPREMHAEWQARREISDAALPAAPEVPMGLPSELLERRPDVRAAEHRLVAANARIGEAKASLFPRLSLTAFAGSVSASLAGLFEDDAWQAATRADVPLTDLGRGSASVRAARARHAAAQAQYMKAIQAAFRETFDALSSLEASREVMRAQRERVAALQAAYESAEARYLAGRIGYLELLDVERQLRGVEQQQVDAELELLRATVDLYRALGGGWGIAGEALAGR